MEMGREAATKDREQRKSGHTRQVAWPEQKCSLREEETLLMGQPGCRWAISNEGRRLGGPGQVVGGLSISPS